MRASPDPPAITLDVRGLLCPLPVLEVARRLEGLAPGERLALVGDDPGILEDLPAWCRRTGHPLVRITAEAGTVHAVVERAGAAPPPAPEPPPGGPAAP